MGGKHLLVNHVDAGAALLEKDLIESALLVYVLIIEAFVPDS